MPLGQKKRLFVTPWQEQDPCRSFAPFAGKPYNLFLDSSRRTHPLARYSYICLDAYERIECRNRTVIVQTGKHEFKGGDPFHTIRERLAMAADMRDQDHDGLPPFTGGAAGFIGYDPGLSLERLPSREPQGIPTLCIGLYDKIIAFDHHSGEAWLCLHADDAGQAAAWRGDIEDIVNRHDDAPQSYNVPLEWRSHKTDEDYIADIDRVIDYIHAGDIFQANLSRRFTAALPENFDRFAHYRRLRAINAAPYAAFMDFGDIALSGASPERFVSVRGRAVDTRPIKGTLSSALPARQLEQSEKDRAENTMIVDLLRNDLSKVCEDHSIDVTTLCGIETFEGLHHMVSTIRGTLRADQGPLDLLRACYPGGSVTGAPKIRAMQIIDELEPDARGPYCGAIGYVGYDGTMDTAISIRTVIYHNGAAQIQTGSGITAESDAAAELRESLKKAEKLFESFSEPRDELFRTGSLRA